MRVYSRTHNTTTDYSSGQRSRIEQRCIAATKEDFLDTINKMNPVNLSKLNDEQLLNMRLCHLDLRIEGTWLEKSIMQLHSELDANGIQFHPPCYLADEWLCPDGEPVIGIAFYLAHPRLKALETRIMLEAEGGTKSWCMMLLRHETGHALNYAYLLHKKKKWRELFGQFSADYPERYKYRPYSKRFVRHLEEWYAQYHPDEDFAETFAVWLNPKSNWRKKYRGWKALDKLLYVDRLMKEIGGKPPKRPEGKKHWDVSRIKSTLNTYYRKKRSFYAEHYPDFHDFHLRKIFQDQPSESGIKADKTILRHRKPLLDEVSFCTGEKKYIINDLLKDLVTRSRELGLYSPNNEADTVMKIAAYVTSLTMNYLYTGRFKKDDK